MDEESEAVRKRVLSELEKVGDGGITWEKLKERLPVYDELFSFYATVMLSLEGFGFITNDGGDKYFLTKKGREVFS